ncbi:MAG: alanine racemase [Planctomycetota bacterium]
MRAVRAWAEIDLDALDRNLSRIRSRAGAGCEVMLVVKADAYGHGAVEVARAAQARGLRTFCVGTAEEAVELRRAGIAGRIVLLGTLVDGEAEDVLAHGVEICVHSSDRCLRLDELARSRGDRARVHLNVDTGMGRLGVPPERALALQDEIRARRGLELVGLMTHVAASGGLDDPGGRAQVERFDALCRRLQHGAALPRHVHAANSACLFTAGERRFTAVRPGIAAFGMLPGHLAGAELLEPVLSLRTRVVFFKDVPAGTPVGYDGTWSAARDSRIATLPIGYNDGMPWRSGNRAEVLVRGRRVPVVGRVSMDYTTIDVTDVVGVEVGDEVVVIGRQGDEEVTANEVARAAGTIAYEITCSIGRRVPRIPVRSSDRDAIVPAVARSG